MDEFAVFFARRAFAARILSRAFAAIDVLCISQGKGKLTRTFGAKKKLCMANAVVGYGAFKTLFQRLLPYDITEFHTLLGEKLIAKGKVFFADWEW